MSILNLTVSQYIVVALLIALWTLIVRRALAWVNERKKDEVKKLWKKRGIETNSFRTRGSQYTLYEKGAMEQLHDVIYRRSLNVIYGACIFLVMALTAETVYFCVTDTPASVYFASLPVWFAVAFLGSTLAVHLAFYITFLYEKRRLTNNKLDE